VPGALRPSGGYLRAEMSPGDQRIIPHAFVAMSALGQKQTSRWAERMSVLPPKADIDRACRDVRYVPKADEVHRSKDHCYSITKIDVGIDTPIALAVFRFSANSKLVGCSTGRSDGFAPLRIFATNDAVLRNIGTVSMP
jgi:hypothetical protein